MQEQAGNSGKLNNKRKTTINFNKNRKKKLTLNITFNNKFNNKPNCIGYK